MYYGHISTASNRADWTEVCVLTDVDTGEAIDITNGTITMTVRKMERNPNAYHDGYYGWGTNPVGGLILTGSTTTGEVVIVDIGTFQWTFPASRMWGLRQGEYEVGIRFARDSTIMQLVVGTIKVIEGIDMQ